jgi:hypothetical protein
LAWWSRPARGEPTTTTETAKATQTETATATETAVKTATEIALTGHRATENGPTGHGHEDVTVDESTTDSKSPEPTG